MSTSSWKWDGGKYHRKWGGVWWWSSVPIPCRRCLCLQTGKKCKQLYLIVGNMALWAVLIKTWGNDNNDEGHPKRSNGIVDREKNKALSTERDNPASTKHFTFSHHCGVSRSEWQYYISFFKTAVHVSTRFMRMRENGTHTWTHQLMWKGRELFVFFAN